MEIERKYLIKDLPDLSSYTFVDIEQGYISTDPVIRIRKKGEKYILTYKGHGLMAREELEAFISHEDYTKLLDKIEGNLIVKHRYNIPFNEYTIELDIFDGHMKGLIMAEVEFPSIDAADSFIPPVWFGADVTGDNRYHNSAMVHGNPFL